MAFEAFRAQAAAPARAGRKRLWYALSIGFHGALIAVGVAYSFWHIEELSPPLLKITFLSAAPPPPPAPPPPAGGGAAAKKKVTVKPKPVVLPKPEIVQPKELPKKEEPKEEPKAEDKGEKDGVKGGTIGGTPGGTVGGTPGGTVGGTPGGVVGAHARRVEVPAAPHGRRAEAVRRRPAVPAVVAQDRSRLPHPGAHLRQRGRDRREGPVDEGVRFAARRAACCRR